MKCKICGSEFTPEKGQLEAKFAINWCTSDKGLLCPPCHAVAKELGAVSEGQLAMCEIPWKSDIAKKSEAVSHDLYLEHRQSESWRIWVETNHPEWV